MAIEGVKVGKLKMNCTIRNMIKSDIESLSHGFMNQGWPAREEILARYFQDQEIGDRVVLYTESEGVLVGYITILPSSKQGRSPVENRNFLILMSLKLFKIKV